VTKKLYGGIEAGGTKFVCAIGTEPDDIRSMKHIPTTTPNETIGKVIDFFKENSTIQRLAAVGIASFGPLDLDRDSPHYGHITRTPKPGWSNTNLVGTICNALQIPVTFDTDVNGAALGEHIWGSAQGLDTFIYLTVGTGIGGGGMVNGRLIRGLSHPEMGHIRIPHDRTVDPYPGSCPYHGDCLEGLACGPALEERWGRRAETLPEAHPAWPLEAHYLALGLVSLISILLPERIIMGGGIMKQPHLFPLVRSGVQELLNGYLQVPIILDRIDDYIVAPGLGSQAGVLGAIVLAEQAAGSDAR